MAEKKGFDLSALLGDVSNLDTDKPGALMMIPIGQITPNDKNFYDVSNVSGLVDAILMDGLQSPLVVNKTGERSYTIISGHRRFTALTQITRDKLQIREGKLFAAEISAGNVPCLVNEYANELQAELALIRANSDTRVLTSAEISKQAERVEMLLYELKEQGYEFPGKMRDYVAEACQVSASKLARLKVIRKKLIPEYKKLYDKGEINESVAYALAQKAAELQRRIKKAYTSDPKYMGEYNVKSYADAYAKIFGIKCKHGEKNCVNCDSMWARYTEPHTYHRACDRCCEKCSEKLNCKAVCPKFKDNILAEKRKEREKNKSVKEAEKLRDAEKIAGIQALWMRLGEARRTADMSVQAVFEALDKYYSEWQEASHIKLEEGETKLTTYSDTPYDRIPPQNIPKLAQLLGVSVEYLLCDTDDPRPTGTPLSALRELDHWRHGDPDEPGYYWCLTGPLRGGGRLYYWTGKRWQHPCAAADLDVSPIAWCPSPPIPEGLSWNRA